MKRREFLTSAAAASGVATTQLLSRAAAQSDAASDVAPQYYELRTYRVESAGQQLRVEKFLEAAALHAWRRAGIGPVGVWKEVGDEAGPSIHALLTFSSVEQFADERTTLEADAGYQSAAEDYLATPKEDPAYSRIESSFMVAFDAMPKLVVPSDAQVYELRIYESYSEAKARRKIEMFNDGEIPIFKDAGFQPVFFGETLIGPRVPNLKYMLASEDNDANRASWGRFMNHPDWVAMRGLPKYADTVSKVTSIKLKPTKYSEI